MRVLSQADCLALWESGQALHPLDRGLLAVHAAFPETRGEDVADWPLGRRNGALAQLRSVSFGSAIRGWTACEDCGDKLEFELDGNTLAERYSPASDGSVRVDGKVFRLPTSRDLAFISGEHDPRHAAMRLMERCMLSSDAQKKASRKIHPRRNPWNGSNATSMPSAKAWQKQTRSPKSCSTSIALHAAARSTRASILLPSSGLRLKAAQGISCWMFTRWLQLMAGVRQKFYP